MQTMEGVGIDKLAQKGRWTSLQNKKARTMKAIEALEASRASVHSSVVSSTASAADKQTLHENLRNANPRLYAMGLEGLFRPVKAVECSCPRCADDQACAGLVLAVCHLTKHRDTSEVNPPPPSAAAPPTQRPPLDNFVPLSVPQRERPVRALLQGIVREHGRCRDW